ncbi:MAG: hypothetical protein ACNA8H_04795 [Anaerolineales bacterium]
MKSTQFIRYPIILCLVFLLSAVSVLPTGLLAAPGTGALAAMPGAADNTSSSEIESQSERLHLISEMTGLRAVDNPISAECSFDPGYQVYLCEEPGRSAVLNPDPEARAQALQMMSTSGVLLIPDSTNKRIMVFDPASGDLIDPDFILLEDEPTGTIIHAILGPEGDSLLISDQTRDVVHQYDLEGNYLGIFAPAGGADTDILDNIRGISLRPNGHLLVTTSAGGNAHAIAEFDTQGEFLGNFIDNGSGGLDSPFDVYGRVETDWLVSSINSNQVLQYEWDTGDPIGEFAPISSFPQQILQIENTNVLVGNFSGTQGVYEFMADGTLVDIYNPAGVSNYRGVYELLNGNILTTTSGGVFEINRDGELVETKYSGQSRFIEFVQLPGISLNKTVGLEEGVCADTDEIVVPAGSLVTYCFEVTNTWDITLELHDLVDDQLGVILDEFPFSLVPGASIFVTQSAEIWEDTTNTATWTAYNPGPSDVVAANDSATVLMLFHGVELSPEELSSSGDPGETVEYTLTLTNTGNAVDTFMVEAGVSEWDVNLVETEFELQPDETADVIVQVEVPMEALAGDQDMVVITAISAGDGSVTASATLTTTANAVYALMLEPDGAALFGDPGETVEYILTLTNTGNAVDTFSMEAGESEWEVQLLETEFELQPDESAEVIVQVDVPMDALAGEQDTVVITATSSGDADATASSTLTTTANLVYGVLLEPLEFGLSGNPGEVVEYSLTLTNTGNAVDIFMVAAGESEWEVHLPETEFELQATEGAMVIIQVSVSEDALAGEMDTVIITATSMGDDSLTSSSTLTTTAHPVYGLMLEPEAATLSGAPAETVEFLLTVTNSGNTSDTFTVEADESDWVVSLPETSFDLEAGDSVEFVVQVSIPPEAEGGDSMVVTIDVTSEGDPSKVAVSELTTVVEIERHWVFLAALFQGSTP